MSKKPKEVARATAKKIAKDLLDTSRQEPLTKQQVKELINKHIEEAYKEVTPENVISLYKTLSLLLHPDKQFSAIDPRLNDYLNQEEFELTSEPFKALNRINQKNKAAKIRKDNLTHLVESVERFMKPMEDALNRYPQPFRFMAHAVYGLLSIGVGAFVFIGVIGLFLSSTLLGAVNGLIGFTLNALTEAQYTKELNAYLGLDFEEYKAVFLRNLKTKIIDALMAQKNEQAEQQAEAIQNMSNEDFFIRLINEQVEIKLQEQFQLRIHSHMANQELMEAEIRQQLTEAFRNEVNELFEQQIKNSVTISDFTRLKLITLAFYHAITKPLAEPTASKLKSIALRATQLIASPFILGAAALTGLAGLVVSGIALIGVGLSFATKTAFLALLNTPLYIVDLGRYAVRKIQGAYGAEADHVGDLSDSVIH